MNEIEKNLSYNPLDKHAWGELQRLSEDSDALVRNLTIYSAGNFFNNRKYDLKHEAEVEMLAWPFVRRALTDPDEVVRQAAYQCAGFFPSKASTSIPYLVQGLDCDGSVAVFAADSIACFGDDARSAVSALVKQLHYGPKSKGGSLGQRASARALGKLGKSAAEVINDLEKIAQGWTGDPEFCLRIVEALYKIEPSNKIAVRLLDEFESGKYGELLAREVKNRIRQR